ncbi:MAG: hypothetical protein O3C23_00890 [bacterium]|nr:hypothetical protein [bacterium]
MCTILCKTEKVFLGGHHLTLRSPQIRDARSMVKLVNSFVQEDAPILINKKLTLKEEQLWLKSIIKGIKKLKF